MQKYIRVLRIAQMHKVIIAVFIHVKIVHVLFCEVADEDTHAFEFAGLLRRSE